MLTLYHAPRSRSSRFVWMLEEIGAPYQLKLVGIRRGDGSGAAADDNPHPHGKVPVLDHDGTIVFESAAIAHYLGDAFPDSGLVPRIGDPARAAVLTMLAYYAGVTEPSFMSAFQKTPVPRGTAGWAPLPEVMEFVLRRLSAHRFICGDAFTAADILYGSTFALFLGNPLLPESSLITDYVNACTSRPAYARAQAKDSG